MKLVSLHSWLSTGVYSWIAASAALPPQKSFTPSPVFPASPAQ